VPRTVECELTEDLVDCCIPGEVVTVTGIVKALNNYMDVGGGKIQSDYNMVAFSINYLLQTSKQQ
jgi:DNA helicase MCM8